MARINVNAKYDVLQNNRRIRLVDRQNGAVVVDFIAPPDTPGGIGDAMKQAFDAIAPPVVQEKMASTAKTNKKKISKRKDEWKRGAAEVAAEVEVDENKKEDEN